MEIYVMRNGDQLGPFSTEDVQAQIADGNLSTSDHARTAGLDDWKPLSEVLAEIYKCRENYVEAVMWYRKAAAQGDAEAAAQLNSEARLRIINAFFGDVQSLVSAPNWPRLNRSEKLARLRDIEDALCSSVRKHKLADAEVLQRNIYEVVQQFRDQIVRTTPTRIERLARRFRKFLVRQRTYRQKQTHVMWIALAALIATWLYPPWTHYKHESYSRGKQQWDPDGSQRAESGTYYVYDRGWYFLFDPKQGTADPSDWSFRIDWSRLFVLDFIIVGIAGGALFTLRQNRNAE